MFSSQEGFSQILVVLILLIAIPIGVYLTLNPTFFKPKANEVNPTFSTTSGGIKIPIKQGAFYQWQKYTATNSVISLADAAKKFQVNISQPDDKRYADEKNYGYSGLFLEYVIFDFLEGPVGFSGANPGRTACNNTQQNWQSTRIDSVIRTGIDYCQIQNSIVNHTTFDHDLNPNTPPVIATENWFLHKSDGTRSSRTNGSNNSMFYYINPGKQEWRDYFKVRVLKDVRASVGSKINSNYIYNVKVDGIYLDNITVGGWGNFGSGTPIEYSSQDKFHSDIVDFVAQVYRSLHDSSKGYNYPLWLNMLGGNDASGQWDSLQPYADGVFKEDFIYFWGIGIYDSTRQLNQLNEAEKWMKLGKNYVSIAWVRSSNIYNDMKYSLAANLLVTDGVHGYYKLKEPTQGSYTYFDDFPEYYYQLGAPVAVKYQKSSSPLVYKRDFQCGYAELDMTNVVGTINYTQGCIPGVFSPTPTPLAAGTPPPTGVNLVKNYGCEVDISNWVGYKAILSRVTTYKHSGKASCQVTLSLGNVYTLDDNPDSMAYPKQGNFYTATTWVRSNDALGKPVKLIIRQKGGLSPTSESASNPINLTKAWQKLKVTTSVDTSDRVSLDIYIEQDSATLGNSFQADDICLARGLTCNAGIYR